MQNVGGLEFSEEKNLVFHWRKISYFVFTQAHKHTHTHTSYIYIYNIKNIRELSSLISLIIYIVCKRLKKTDDIVNLLSFPKLSVVRSFFGI